MSISSLIRSERLPADFAETVNRIYRPIASRLAGWHAESPLLVGINGGQGTGKSTLSLFLKCLLENEHQLPTAVLSIDDLYLTRAERLVLSKSLHPLLATRGVPGTHDVPLGLRVIDALMHARPGEETAIPRFNKGCDDRYPEADWPRFPGRAHVVILEGWCVGARPQEEPELAEPINHLERLEDPNGTWRRYVNHQIGGPYATLFGKIDRLIFLRAPDMASIRKWRGRQELKLREKLIRSGGDLSLVMDDAALDRFIHHYQRLTQHQGNDLAERADIVLQLDRTQQIETVRWKGEPA